MSTYVYGITAASHPPLPEGMGGVGDPARPVRVLTEGELAAVVSDAPRGLRPKRRELLAHQNVLAEIGAGGCVLPMRFGSVAPTTTPSRRSSPSAPSTTWSGCAPSTAASSTTSRPTTWKRPSSTT